MKNPWHVFPDGSVKQLQGSYITSATTRTYRTKTEAKKAAAPLLAKHEKTAAYKRMVKYAPELIRAVERTPMAHKIAYYDGDSTPFCYKSCTACEVNEIMDKIKGVK